jgi:hypothetical protein
LIRLTARTSSDGPPQPPANQARRSSKFSLWGLYTDWRLTRTPASPIRDLYSDLVFRPPGSRESEMRYASASGCSPRPTRDPAPNETWSWKLSHWYLNNEVSGILRPAGQQFIDQHALTELNENWDCGPA